jgi:hypothetical protein
MSFAELLALFDPHIVNGRHYELRTRWLADLTPEIVSQVVSAGEERTSPDSLIVLQHCHGAATRVTPDATSFGLRRPHFMVEICAAWEGAPEDEASRHRRTFRRR